MLVDTLTIQFSAQKLVENALNHSVHFLYWGVIKDQNFRPHNFTTLFPFNPNYLEIDIFTASWDLMEYLMTAVEPIISHVEDGKPVYYPKPQKFEAVRIENYVNISKGEVAYA